MVSRCLDEGLIEELYRTSVDSGGGPGLGVGWSSSGRLGDETRLTPWRAAVGPAFTHVPATQVNPEEATESEGYPALTIVVWNARVGGGALRSFWRDVMRRAQPGPIVLLLQEVFSSGGSVPDPFPPGATFAGSICDSPVAEARMDIASFAVEAGLFAAYVPSMRNGQAPEDRGNAILATVPLSDIDAVELAFERQRRVAVAATVRWRGGVVRACSVHLDNRAPWRRAWRSLGAARARQMSGLVEQLSSAPDGLLCNVLGGDFNTWVGGTAEEAYRVARSHFPDPSKPDPRGTHHFEIGSVLRHSDHLLFKLPEGCNGDVSRLDDTFGSDHYPLIGTLSVAER